MSGGGLSQTGKSINSNECKAWETFGIDIHGKRWENFTLKVYVKRI